MRTRAKRKDMPSNEISFTTTFAAYRLGFWLVNALQRIKSSVGWQNLLALKAASYPKKNDTNGKKFWTNLGSGPKLFRGVYLGGVFWD